MTDLTASPAELVRAEIRRAWGVLAFGLSHDEVEEAGWTPTGDPTADWWSWCAVYDLVVARRAVIALRASPSHKGAPGWRAAVERWRVRRAAS